MIHRRRLAEQVAPWALMAVLAAMWWGGSKLVRWSGLPETLPAAPTSTTAKTSLPASGERTTVPAPRDVPDPLAASSPPDDANAAETDSLVPVSASGLPVVTFQDITALRGRTLKVPVEGVAPEALVPSYRDTREGTRRHEAMDILAERGTPVLAVEDGRLAKLFNSRNGGLTIYQFDPTEQFAYYYAHLDRYAPNLKEGDLVHRGQVLGAVGTTGNAPPDTPHLHFGIFKLSHERRWWEGTPLDPYVIWR